MATPQTRLRDERPRLRPLAALCCAGLALALTGCIETYRSIAGVNKNDPDPQTALFTGNMAEAEAGPYPNLASVPPPPTQATTAAERQKLTSTLVAEREATSAAKEGLPVAPATASGKEAAPRSAKLGSVKQPPGSAAAPSMAAASRSGISTNGMAGPGAAPTTTSETKLATTASPLEPASSARRSPGAPAEPRPRDSSMQMPEVRSTPEPETSRPAPPKAALAAVTPPAAIAAPPAAATMTPAPAPAAPVLAPVPPPPTLATAMPSRTPPSATTVATVEVAGARLNPAGQAEIDRVASLYKEKPGTVRVIARTPPPSSGAEGLAGYHAALGNAQAVADGLKAAGIPANKIQTEATPSAAATPGKIEIQFAP